MFTFGYKGASMKIALKCKSVLISKALEFYLKEYLTEEDKAEIIVADHHLEGVENLFLISKDKDANLSVPFTKEMLLDALEEFDYKNRQKSKEEIQMQKIVEEISQKQKKKIDKIIKSYSNG